MSKPANLRLYRVSVRCKTIVAPVTHINPPDWQTNHLRITFMKTKFALCMTVMCITSAIAVGQTPELAQRVAEIKQASAANKEALARYTWQEQQAISLKGEVKKTTSYQVSIGLNGQQQKIDLGSSAAPP